MNKLFNLIIGTCLCIPLFLSSCDNHKTYADMLSDERAAISDYIKENNITVISQTDFMNQDETTNLDKNEYVHLNSGIYMQIVSKGDVKDTVRNNDIVLVKFSEYNILKKEDALKNTGRVDVLDEFRYNVTNSSIAGIFINGYMLQFYGSSVPAGWLVPLKYVGNRAHVKLIIPSKMGHQTAMRGVVPYFYDIEKYQIYK